MITHLPIRPSTKVVWVVKKKKKVNCWGISAWLGRHLASTALKEQPKSNPALENLYQLAKDKLFLEFFLQSGPRFSVRMGGSRPKGNSFKASAAGNCGRQSDFDRAGSEVVKFKWKYVSALKLKNLSWDVEYNYGNLKVCLKHSLFSNLKVRAEQTNPLKK